MPGHRPPLDPAAPTGAHRGVHPSAGVPFPGIPSVLDGSEAVASVETRLSEIACVYPITPSTTMAAVFQAAVADGRTNLWGTPLRFIEPESEHSSASAAEGAALSGARVTNFTAGQGLVLMKEVLFVIAGKRLPAVFHVGARALTSQALNIHAGHDDVMAVADTGWGILFARNVQEAVDLAVIARRVSEATEVPFFVVQDGFLTTHTLESTLVPEDGLLVSFVGDPRERLRAWFDPTHPLMTGVVQNQDSYMKGRIGQREFYARVPAELDAAFEAWEQQTGRRHGSLEPYRLEDATEVIVAMGTIADTATAVVDHLRAAGRRVGCLAVTAYRPFPARAIAAALAHVRAVAVVERTDEPAAAEGPLAREIKAALFDVAAEGAPVPRVRSVAAGLGSRDVGAGDLEAVFEWLVGGHPACDRHYATLGIRHPSALPARPLDLRPPGAFSMRGHSIGGFGSVTTNKLVASLVGRLFDLQVQAYPRYGSEKKGLPTSYFLTVAAERSREHGEATHVEFVALHDVAAFHQGGPLRGLADGGIVFVQSALHDAAGIWASIPEEARTEIMARGIRVAALDTASLARRWAPRPDLVVRMQGIALVGAFLRLTPFAERAGMDRAALLVALRPELERFFGKRGAAVVEANHALVTQAYDEVIDVTAGVTAVVAAPAHAIALVGVR
jgi:pyruvate-ferredoxin/flavodoxin oxidoreductase